jgi:hypothetical protein
LPIRADAQRKTESCVVGIVDLRKTDSRIEDGPPGLKLQHVEQGAELSQLMIIIVDCALLVFKRTRSMFLSTKRRKVEGKTK